MNSSCIFWLAFLLCITQIRHGMCDGEQNDDPVEEDYPDYPDESGEIIGNTTEAMPLGIVGDEPVSETIQPDVESAPTIPQTIVTVEPTASPPPPPPPSFKCPVNCKCSEAFRTVDCSHQQLTQVPADLPLKTARLDLSHNQLTTLNISNLVGCVFLRELIVNDNQIEVIHDNAAFVRLPNLDYIDLASNLLKPLNGQEFRQARSLTNLILANNTNVIDDSTAFASHSLHGLNLFNCSIVTLPDKIFQNLSSLISLDLRQNPLDLSSDVEAFKALSHLRVLKVPTLAEPIFKRLCGAMEVIDVINVDKIDLSCYLFNSGLTYAESSLKIGQTTVQPDSDDEYIVTHPPQIFTLAPDVTKAPLTSANETKLVPNISNEQTSKQTNQLPQVEIPSGNNTINQTNPSNKDTDEARVDISDETVQIILIALICVTVIAIMIGVLCRMDCCGMKTKCCRRSGNRATTEDRNHPHEEIPLNKV